MTQQAPQRKDYGWFDKMMRGIGRLLARFFRWFWSLKWKVKGPGHRRCFIGAVHRHRRRGRRIQRRPASSGCRGRAVHPDTHGLSDDAATDRDHKEHGGSRRLADAQSGTGHATANDCGLSGDQSRREGDSDTDFTSSRCADPCTADCRAGRPHGSSPNSASSDAGASDRRTYLVHIVSEQRKPVLLRPRSRSEVPQPGQPFELPVGGSVECRVGLPQDQVAQLQLLNVLSGPRSKRRQVPTELS